MEQACALFADLDIVIARPFNVYGPGAGGVIAHFIAALRAGSIPVVHGSGGQLRDFIHVADVCDALLALAAHERAAGEIVNIGSGVGTTVLALLVAVAETMRMTTTAAHVPRRDGDVVYSVANMDKMATLFDWRASIELREGLEMLLCPK